MLWRFGSMIFQLSSYSVKIKLTEETPNVQQFLLRGIHENEKTKFKITRFNLISKVVCCQSGRGVTTQQIISSMAEII